jgi:hypothetical protein
VVSVALLLSLSTVLDAAQREITLRRTFWAVAWVESKGDPRAVNRREQAVGIVQIRPIMVRDVNRIVGRGKYNLSDRTDVERSYEMFRTFSRYYAPRGTPEIWSRNWNGGPKGSQKQTTAAYWLLVQKAMGKPLSQKIG